MIRVRVWGGLGNQMFIYAFAKALSLQGYQVSLDVSFYKFDRHKINIKTNSEGGGANRKLEISNLNLTLPLLNYSPLCISSSKTNLFTKALGKGIRIMDDLINRQNLIKEDKNFIDKWKNQNFSKNTVFQGYFQNTIYFDNIRSEILKDFSFSNPLTPSNQAIKERILSTNNSCFLHIRLGDYLNHENWMFAKLGQTYYTASINFIKKKINTPTFFIFSNDIKWCKANFLQSLNEETKKGCIFFFIENNNEGDAIQELELMKSCQNAIIANSTFSWWGAYLIENQKKICLIPSHFMYYDRSISHYIPKLNNKNWHIIDIVWGTLFS